MSDQPTEPTEPSIPPPPTSPPVAPPGPPPDAGSTSDWAAPGTDPTASTPPPGEYVSMGPASKPPKPKKPRPAIGLTGPGWIRPAFYYLACLVGILVGTWGAVNTAQGVVHLIAPDIAQQGDPITRFASTIVNLVDAGVQAGAEEFEDEIEDAGGDDAVDGFDAVIESTKDELRSQARKAAVDELLSGLIFLGVGIAIYRFHWLRVEPEVEPTEPAEADDADLAAP